jgi:hypothetical protein
VSVARLEYDLLVRRLNSAPMAGLALALMLLFLAPAATAQVNGVPASVSSINFGGKANSTPGVPASITSLGSNGVQLRNPFFNEPACCINPLFPVNSNPPLFNRNHHHHHGQVFPAGGAVYVPYAVPYAVPVESDADSAYQAEQEQEQDHRGGSTIFDRRGSGEPAAYRDSYPNRASHDRAETEPALADRPAETSVADQPQTVLVFKDGHQMEVQNYAVLGNMLYDLSPGRYHKIALADLDLASTIKQNEERGVDFQLPPKAEAKTETSK